MEMNSKWEKCRILLLNQSNSMLDFNFLRYFGRSLRDHIAQSACDLVARRAYCVGGSLKIMCVRPCVCVSVRLVIKNDQVLNGKTSLWKVSSSKRDPKKGRLSVLIARFWDVDEISGTERNWRIIEEEWRISIETWRDAKGAFRNYVIFGGGWVGQAKYYIVVQYNIGRR
mgnify:CR=1 FL=1